MARTKATLYLDPEILRATRVSAARKGRSDSDIVEDALRQYLGLDVLEKVWSRSDLSEGAAMKLVDEEVHAHRWEKPNH